MISLGVIEPVEQPTEWCSGLTIAPKANGAIRMCVDLTALNKGVKRETYPLLGLVRCSLDCQKERYFPN